MMSTSTLTDYYTSLRARLLSLEIAVEWQRPNPIPGPVLGNVLRGAFGITFRRLVCPPDWMNSPCAPCPLYAQCPYGHIFEPSPPADADRLRKQADLPRPFVLKPPGPGVRSQGAGVSSWNTGSQLRFGLVLFGRAIDYLPHFVVTLAELGRTGMGRDRVPFEIKSIDALYPDAQLSTLNSHPLYDPATHQLRRPERFITEADLLAPSGTPRSLTVRFVTPTLIRTGSGIGPDGRRIPAREVRERPEFGTLIRRLRDRLAALCAFFGEAPWETDFTRLGERADAVRLRESRTAWQHRTRRSTRTGQSHELSGLTGEATYLFPDERSAAEFLPLLRFGECFHVGKHAVWGNGWLSVEGDGLKFDRLEARGDGV